MVGVQQFGADFVELFAHPQELWLKCFVFSWSWVYDLCKRPVFVERHESVPVVGLLGRMLE